MTQQTTEEKLLQAIKKDDVKAFDALMKNAQCGAYRLGRFPVLSLMYLYKSRKILSEYEASFLQIANFEELREPLEISKKFKAKAGKCLRLYLDEIVSPLEMLLILDRTKHLKLVYPQVKPSSAVKARLKSIYSIRYSLSVKYEGDNIIMDRRPLSRREKKKIFTASVALVLALAIIVGVPVTTVTLMPKPVEGEVTALGQIDFGATKTYTLKQDIIIPDNYSVEKVNCEIIGEGRKLILGKGATLGELNGKISNITIESSGNAIFTTVAANATIRNVTVNVNASVTSSKGIAFVALTNYGIIDGVTVNVTGRINAVATSAQVSEEVIFGGIVQTNDYKYNAATQSVYVTGVINNCTVNYSRFELVGEASANAEFGGVAGINNGMPYIKDGKTDVAGGYVQNCTVTGEIIADTFDVAGVCVVNNHSLYGDVNKANLYQTSSDAVWNPVVSGIVINNTFAVDKCENTGVISSVSDCGQFQTEEDHEYTATAAGIAYLNRSSSVNPFIRNSINSGEIRCSAEYRNAYAAGVCISSSGSIAVCKNSGAVTADADNDCDTYVGGIAVLAYGDITKSENNGNIGANGKGTAYAGGISAYTCAMLSYCFSSGEVKAQAKNVCAGGIFGISDVINNMFFVYFGIADHCISECEIDATATDAANAYIGGIAGFIREAGFNSNESVVYFGGAVTNSFFTGEFAAEVGYVGNIVGVCGDNIYKNNSYAAGNETRHNFEENRYLSNSLKAFGAAMTIEGSPVSVGDKGASSATLEDMKNSAEYKAILEALAS